MLQNFLKHILIRDLKLDFIKWDRNINIYYLTSWDTMHGNVGIDRL